MKKIGILGSGVVGQTLANGLTKAGYEVVVGSRMGGKVENWDGKVDGFYEVARDSDIVILAVLGAAAESLVASLTKELAGKTVIDATNPISKTPAQNGVLHYFTSLEHSLMESLQLTAPKTNFVKALNSVGNNTMINPKFKDGTPTMFICGNSKSAKKEAAVILNKIGWEVEDMGMVESARAIEPLCMLWCIPGIINNDWSSRAFKLLKK